MVSSTSFTILVRFWPAQFGSGAVANLPDSPLFQRLAFENPWALMILLVIAAAVAWIVLNRMGRTRRAIQTSAALCVAAIGLWILAGQVTTAREIIKLKTRQFIQAVATADVQTVEDLLTPDARLYNIVGGTRGGGGVGGSQGVPVDAIVSQLQNFRPGAPYEIEQVAFLDLQSTLDGPKVGRTQVRIRVTPVNGGLVFAWFRFDWRQVPDGDWQVKGIDLLWSSWNDGW